MGFWSFRLQAPYSMDLRARARTFAQLCSLIAIALELFTPDEGAACARHCGYRATP